MTRQSIDLYQKVLKLIEQEMFMKEEEILASNKEESVQARKVLVLVLAEYLTDTEIGKLTGLKQVTISAIKRKCLQCNQSWSCEKAKEKIKRSLLEILD